MERRKKAQKGGPRDDRPAIREGPEIGNRDSVNKVEEKSNDLPREKENNCSPVNTVS